MVLMFNSREAQVSPGCWKWQRLQKLIKLKSNMVMNDLKATWLNNGLNPQPMVERKCKQDCSYCARVLHALLLCTASATQPFMKRRWISDLNFTFLASSLLREGSLLHQHYPVDCYCTQTSAHMARKASALLHQTFCICSCGNQVPNSSICALKVNAYLNRCPRKICKPSIEGWVEDG